MQVVKGVDPKTGSEFNLQVNDIDKNFIDRMSDLQLTNKSIDKMISGLEISSDAKLLLSKISETAIQVGSYIVNIGRKIIDSVCWVYKEYPSATFGLVCGAVIGGLIASIPIIGFVLGPLFLPLAAAFGLAKGVTEDLKDKQLSREIAKIRAEFAPLKAAS